MPDTVNPVSDIPSAVTSMRHRIIQPPLRYIDHARMNGSFLRQLTPQRGILGGEINAVSGKTTTSRRNPTTAARSPASSAASSSASRSPSSRSVTMTTPAP
jgi:hypothetical protein